MINDWKPYTIDLYLKDYYNLQIIWSATKNITIPEEELPKIRLKDSILILNTNNPESDMVYYFIEQYPKSVSQYYCLIFWETEAFISRNFQALVSLTYIRKDKDNSYEICEPLVKTILDSFYLLDTFPPITSTLMSDDDKKLDFDKVVKATKLMIEQEE